MGPCGEFTTTRTMHGENRSLCSTRAGNLSTQPLGCIATVRHVFFSSYYILACSSEHVFIQVIFGFDETAC